MVQELQIEDEDPCVSQTPTNFSHSLGSENLSHPSFPPARYFDNLPRPFLTRNALREHDLRNDAKASSVPVALKRHQLGPVTRLTVRQREKSYRSAKRILEQLDMTSGASLKRYAKHGGPDLTGLRGFHSTMCPALDCCCGAPTLEMTNPNCPKRKGKVKPSDRNFRQHLIVFGVLPFGYVYPNGQRPPQPENKAEILAALAAPRPSLEEWSQSDFEDFALFRAPKEHNVKLSILPLLECDGTVMRNGGYGDLRFENLYQLTDGTLAPGNPDNYHGSQPEQLHPIIQEELGDYIFPTTQSDLPIVPNFFLHLKCPDGSIEVAQNQALYDGTLGARGIHNLRSYGLSNETMYDNKAYTITATYSDGLLKLYAIHPIYSSISDRTEFIMTQLRAISLFDDLDSLRKGVAVYRNALDWARKQRDEAINQANARVHRRRHKAGNQANATTQDQALATVDGSRPSIQVIALPSAEDYNDGNLIKSLKLCKAMYVVSETNDQENDG
ncbi:hypothetical protein EDB81DRAFT_131137 [Dactylonectria macrodidyma]|uniref:Uncharacterized protein n=1 Tax=Dactylonectria macrodidyma TaxID=307937 RepID=A0A9P9E581_9HYPO|nr:hypothetical protein EDB81DRAFT_131137 [Dactylonectria macrodidyma]